MEGRKIKPLKKSGSRKSKSHRSSHTSVRERRSDERYYLSDEEDSGCQKSRRYSCTSFPLFSNLSDDEVILSQKQTHQDACCMKISHSAPSGRYLKQEDLEYLQIDESKTFPFQYLPVHCKFKVFSYLSSFEKGVGFRVCREWHDMLLSPSLWTRISFWDFPMSCVPSASHDSRISCYSCYKKRVHLFTSSIVGLRPILKRLEYKFDIGDSHDGYLEMLQSIISHVDLRDLQYVLFNWKETPTRPFWREKLSCEDVVSNHRQRGRTFVYIFDSFSKAAPRITTLVMPFHWSSRSVQCLTRFKNLHSLVLEKYFFTVSLQQKLIDRLLNGLPKLKRLLLEVWTPSGPGLVIFRMSSTSLEYLDVSQSRGFYLEALNMQKLKYFRVSRHPWNGPLVCPESRILPCLYNVLVLGAPKLLKINDHYLEQGWRNFCYPTLDEVLKSVCACQTHKTEWAV